MDTDAGVQAEDAASVNPTEEAPLKTEATVSTPPEPDPDAGPEQSEDALATAISQREQAAVAAYRGEQDAAFKTLTQQTWVNELKADPEFGGEKYLVTVEEVKRAADRFLTPADKDILNQTGFGNNPMLVKFFARIGRAMANDKLVTGNSGGAVIPKSDAQVIYPGMNP